MATVASRAGSWRNYPRITSGRRSGIEWLHARSASPRGIVVVPPLIGGHAVQQIRLLRRLPAYNLDVLSFNYSGHGNSGGKFSLNASLDDTRTVMEMAFDLSRRHNLCLYGAAACYAAVPLLATACRYGEPLQKVVLFNAVFSWRLRSIAMSFLQYWAGAGMRPLTPRGVVLALRRYAQDLFPRAMERRRGFGILGLEQLAWPRIIREILSVSPLSDVALIRTPVLCVYGLRDKLLQQWGWSCWTEYEKHVRRVCPLTEFLPVAADHYIDDPSLRRRVSGAAAAFFNGSGSC